MRTDLTLIIVGTLVVSACGAGRVAPLVVPAAPDGAPRLAATRFIAFGDSLTEGFVQACRGPAAVSSEQARGVTARPGVRGAPFSAVSYPNRLQALLSRRYASQTIEVINEGVGGEDIRSGAASLAEALASDKGHALLLLEGINNINARHAAGIPDVVNGLRSMIQEARNQGLVVFVGTLLPEREGSCRALDYSDQVNDIIAANVQIRSMVGNEGAVLVDLYRVFSGRTAVLLGEDGLHPSAAGYQAIADAFFAAIRRSLDDPRP